VRRRRGACSFRRSTEPRSSRISWRLRHGRSRHELRRSRRGEPDCVRGIATAPDTEVDGASGHRSARWKYEVLRRKQAARQEPPVRVLDSRAHTGDGRARVRRDDIARALTISLEQPAPHDSLMQWEHQRRIGELGSYSTASRSSARYVSEHAPPLEGPALGRIPATRRTLEARREAAGSRADPGAGRIRFPALAAPLVLR
jgi:hypothetical protein